MTTDVLVSNLPVVPPVSLPPFHESVFASLRPPASACSDCSLPSANEAIARLSSGRRVGLGGGGGVGECESAAGSTSRAVCSATSSRRTTSRRPSTAACSDLESETNTMERYRLIFLSHAFTQLWLLSWFSVT